MHVVFDMHFSISFIIFFNGFITIISYSVNTVFNDAFISPPDNIVNVYSTIFIIRLGY